jgi:hypothetical protein
VDGGGGGVMISVRYGNFDWAHPRDEQVQIRIQLPVDMNPPAAYYNEIWNADDDPFDTSIPPSEWIEIFSSRLNKYIYTSNRQQKIKVLEWMTDNAAELDSRWAKKRINSLQKKIKSLTREIARLQEVR